MEQYSLLFIDTLASNIVFCFTSEFALASMKAFNLYNKYLLLLVALSSFTLASTLNYYFGKICYKILAPFNRGAKNIHDTKKSTPHTQPLKQNNIIYFALLLSGTPFTGKFIVFFAGFYKANFIRTILITICSKLVYYIYFMMF